jgi:CHASE2 domain-containing sensor protein
MIERSRTWVSDAVARLRKKKLSYWCVAIVVLLLAYLAAPQIYERLGLGDVRSRFFQTILDWGPRPVEPRRIKILKIEDDEYWLGPLAGRRPIKRDYLASLIDKLVAMNVHIIALDFDVRLPNPNSFEIPEEYRVETQKLIDAIKNAARSGKRVVLASPVSFADSGGYRKDSDIYQANDLCSSDERTGDAVRSHVTCGYIALPYDPLRIPPPIDLDSGSKMDSFGLAIARSENPHLIGQLLARKKELGYLNFITPEGLARANAIFSARQVRSEGIGRDELDSKIVIIGAGWSRDAAGRGPPIDTHSTPVGEMNGVELHANYAEALLDSRIFEAVPENWLHWSEIAFSIFAALVLAGASRLLAKVIAFFVLFTSALAISAIALLLLGIFFDALVPLVGLGLHAFIEPYMALLERTLHHTGAAIARAFSSVGRAGE